jgi:hypothetical protein
VAVDLCAGAAYRCVCRGALTAVPLVCSLASLQQKHSSSGMSNSSGAIAATLAGKKPLNTTPATANVSANNHGAAGKSFKEINQLKAELKELQVKVSDAEEMQHSSVR